MKKRRPKKRKTAAASDGPPILNPREIEGMRRAGHLAAAILDEIAPRIRPGLTTLAIDQWVAELTAAAGAKSAPLGYHGFPRNCCTSINEVVCHGIPSPDRVLYAGDIINVDVTPVLEGWHGDTSRTFFVGEVSAEARQLVDTTYRAMWLAIERLKPGANIGEVGRTIQPYVEALGYSVVREFTGHGLGQQFHTRPTVFHHITLGLGETLAPGMALTIEPMVNAGRWKTRVLGDGWTAVTIDGKLSAQFEHTVVITDSGVEVLTLGANETPPTQPATTPSP